MTRQDVKDCLWALALGTSIAFLQCLAGCGEVTSADNPALVGRGPTVDIDAGELAEVGQEGGPLTEDVGGDRSLPDNADLMTQAADVDGPLSCLTACEPCAHAAGLDGPPYDSAAQCARVIECARSGDAGDYPWQTCHSASGAAFSSGGLHCALAAAAAGCR